MHPLYFAGLGAGVVTGLASLSAAVVITPVLRYGARRLRFDASRKDRSMPDKKFEFYEVFSAPTAFDTFLLHSVLDCASQRPEDAPETANTQNKKEITMDFKKLYFTLFNTLSDAVEQIDTHDYEEARLLLIHAQQEAEECYITSA